MVATKFSGNAFHHSSTTSSQSSTPTKMSISQTYFLAHRARSKLSGEAARSDHNLRLLVGHANLLDSLMLDLAEAEREQESWFNQSVRGASRKTEDRQVQWADSNPERSEEDWEDDDSSDFDSVMEDDEDVEMRDAAPLRPAAGVPASPHLQHMDEDEEFEDDDDGDDEDYESLALQRSPSKHQPPPELEHDEDSSEDELMPPSPPFAAVPLFSDKQREVLTTIHYDPEQQDSDHKADFYRDGYYLPSRNPASVLSAISVC